MKWIQVLNSFKIWLNGNEVTLEWSWIKVDLAHHRFKIPYTDMKTKIKRFLHTKSQQPWKNNIRNKLFLIKLTLGRQKLALGKSRKEQVTLSRLRSGLLWPMHNRDKVTCSFLDFPSYSNKNTSIYNMSNTQYLWNEEFSFIGKYFFNVNNMKDLFENANTDEIAFWEKQNYTKNYKC